MIKPVAFWCSLFFISVVSVNAQTVEESLSTSISTLEKEGRRLSDLRQWGGAQKVYGKILEMNEKRLGKDDPRLLPSLSNLVRVTCVDGKCADTVPSLNQMLAIRLKLLGPRHADVATTYALLAEANEKMFRYNEAITNFNKAIEVRDEVFGKTASIAVSTRLNLIRVMLKQHDLVNAERVRLKCQTLADQQKPRDQALLTKIRYYQNKIAENQKKPPMKGSK